MHNHEERGHDCCHGETREHRRTCPISPQAAKFILGLLAMLLLAGIIVVSILRDKIVSNQYRQVTITGTGRVSYQPDLALITLGVQIDKVAQAEEALSQLNTKVAGITSALEAVGIAKENIQTQSYSLYPQYDYRDNVSVVGGYSANQQLTIKVDNYNEDPEKLSKAIAAASKAGANQILSLSFDSSSISELKQEARLKAIEDAKSKSGALAQAAGVELKDINNWWENVMPAPVYSSYSEAKGGLGGGEPQLPSGDREVVVEMGLTYNLK